MLIFILGYMGSGKTVTGRKIADALVNGKGINMAGCTKPEEGRCPKCPRDKPDSK